MEKIETKVVKPEVSFFENETNNLIISTQEESTLDSKIKDIEDYMKNNSGKGKSEQEKDELYQNAQNLWHKFAEALKSAKYNFYLNRPQYKFLTDLILTKMEYDVNTVFFAIELTDMMGNMKNAKYSDDKELNSFEVNATEITYIYHLISKHKVKGLSKDAYTFSQILYRIGSISKLFGYYETAYKSLSTDIQNWVLTFEDGVEMESAKPKKAKKEKEVTE
jgi:hypothetical protein